jgi:hypothetical protein
MRSIVRTSVMFAGALLLFAGANANAAEGYSFEVKVPFPFVVTGQSFPAGQYMVEEEANGTSLLLRGEKGNHAVTFLTTIRASRQEPAGTDPALTFTRSENQYWLSSVWESGSEGWRVMGR